MEKKGVKAAEGSVVKVDHDATEKRSGSTWPSTSSISTLKGNGVPGMGSGLEIWGRSRFC